MLPHIERHRITVNYTRDRRRAHWHIMGEALTGPNRCRNGRESAVCEASGRDKAVRAVRLNYSLCPEINVVDGLQSCQCPNPHYIFGHRGRVQSDVRSLNTTIVEGSIERHKPRLASRETGDRLTGTYSGGSLDRTESVPKCSRERRALAGLREASRRD